MFYVFDFVFVMSNVFFKGMVFNFRLYWLEYMIIRSLKINGMDVKSYIDIKGVIKLFVYKVNYLILI